MDSLETTLPSRPFLKQLSRLHRAQYTLGPNREVAFLQQLFDSKSGAQVIPTSHLPARGIPSPWEGVRWKQHSA